MFSIKTIIPTLLIGGLVAIEVLTGNPAQSQRQLTPAEAELVRSILSGEEQTSTTDPLPATDPSYIPFIDLDFPFDPQTISEQNQLSYGTIIGDKVSSLQQVSLDASQALAEVMPPVGSALYYAYQDGGTAWYKKSNQVLVIFPDQTIQSFNSSTGESTDWLQDKLNRLPVSDPTAYQLYQTNYRAKIVADGGSWVLMEFPSGEVLKVSKPQYATPTPPLSANPSLPN